MISDDPISTIPHREPFLWVSRLIERNDDGTEGVCELDVKPEWDVFKGHFPGNPIFPGVLQMEAAAQACLWVNVGKLAPGKQPPDVLFVSVDSYKFRRPVVPPMTLRIYGKQRAHRGKLYLWDLEITDKATGEMMSKGTFWMQKTEKA